MKIYNIIIYSITELSKFGADEIRQLAENYNIQNLEALERHQLIYLILEAQENFISQKIIFQNQ